MSDIKIYEKHVNAYNILYIASCITSKSFAQCKFCIQILEVLVKFYVMNVMMTGVTTLTENGVFTTTREYVTKCIQLASYNVRYSYVRGYVLNFTVYIDQ